MVLVDTSIWIRSFASLAPYVNEIDRLLDLELVAKHELVFGELLIGDLGGREKFLRDYAHYHEAPRAPHSEVVALVRLRSLHGRGLGWIDAHLLASTLVGRLRLWTADPRLAVPARELGISY